MAAPLGEMKLDSRWRVEQPGMQAASNRIGDTVVGQRFSVSHTYFQDTRLVFHQKTYRLATQSPLSCQIGDAVMDLEGRVDRDRLR